MTDIRKYYEDNFDPKAYLSTYINEDYELRWKNEDYYHELFSKGKLPGKSMLDVGSGPTVRPAISASATVKEIYLGELLERNREVVQKWLRKEASSADFTAEFTHVAKLEGKTDIKYLEDRVRRTVKDVFQCDILADNPLHPHPLRQYDIVTTNFCLDCFPDDKDYFRGMKNLGKLIRQGGHLALCGSLECTDYTVGTKTFPSAFVTVEKARKAMEEAGLEVLELKENKYRTKLDIDCNSQGMITALARKK